MCKSDLIFSLIITKSKGNYTAYLSSSLFTYRNKKDVIHGTGSKHQV